jgi:hypothetical protein
MKSNLSRWGLSRYYITKEGILYFKTLNKGWVKNNSFHFLEHPSGPNHPNYNKPPHNKLSLRKERRVLRLYYKGLSLYYKGLNIKDIQLRLRLKSSTSIRRILKNRNLLD